ncbi:MAG TPA: MarR family winged helix-turn-helix transcriptional regulator [Holophagaceae bacterium]|jgi:DNA-binding MarR family transcriptional regulator|nr:MarR family winged helix-turn-helix transcriptional regulator [Holophagaceae bacterium]
MQEATLPSYLEHAPLGQLIAATRRRIKQALWAHLSDDNLTPQQYWILMVLMEHGPHSLHELAGKVCIDDPTACRIVKALSARGLTASSPDPDHGRRILIRMAPGTEALQKRLKGMAAKVRGGLEYGFSDEEKAVLRSGLMKVIANMDTLETDLSPGTKRPLPAKA